MHFDIQTSLLLIIVRHRYYAAWLCIVMYVHTFERKYFIHGVAQFT